MGVEVAVRPDQVSIGVLVDAVPRDAVAEAVAVCGVRERRSDGKLPGHVTAYLTLALCLFPDDGDEEVATRVTGSLDRFGYWDTGWTVPTASAVTQARKRLGRGRNDRATPFTWTKPAEELLDRIQSAKTQTSAFTVH